MKYIFVMLSLTAIGYSGCLEAGKAPKADEQSEVQSNERSDTHSLSGKEDPGRPSESYEGLVKGAPLRFEHWNYTRYRLREGDQVTTGSLNTERGYEEDEDATLFILDYDGPAENHRYFVRYSSGRFVILGSHGHEIEDQSLELKE